MNMFIISGEFSIRKIHVVNKVLFQSKNTKMLLKRLIFFNNTLYEYVYYIW